MLSLLFNVFFIVGYYGKDKSCKKRHTPQRRVEQLAKELDLDKKQQEEILALFIKESDRFKGVMESKRNEIKKIWNELCKENPDQKIIDDFINSDSKYNRHKHIVERTRELIRILRPDQRVKAGEMLWKLRPRMKKGKR